MYYDALSRNTVKITLTEQDMRSYSIKSDALLRRSAETKRALTKFLKKFQSESCVFAGTSTDRLFLEAFPSKDGGCVLYVSTLGTAPVPENEQTDVQPELLMMTPSLDAAVSLCARISKGAHSGFSSSFFLCGKDYSLIIRTPENEKQLMRIMAEYGETSDDPVDIAFVRENAKLLIENDAVSKLAPIA